MKKILLLILLPFLLFAQTDIPVTRIRVDSIKALKTTYGGNDSIHIKSRVKFYRTAEFDSMIILFTPLAATYGGTGLTSYGSLNTMLGMNADGTELEYKTLSTGTTGTDFAIAHSAGAVAFNLPTASATVRGALSSANWTTFNNKIGSLNGLTDVTQTFAIDTTISGPPAWSSSSPTHTLQLPFPRMKQISWTVGLQDSLTNKPNLNTDNTFSNGTTQTMPKIVIDTSLTVMGHTPRLNTLYNPTEFIDTINTSTYDAFGVLMQLSNGTWLTFYRQGTSHNQDYGKIMMRSSTNQGKAWSDSTIVASEDSVDLRDASGGVTPDGRVIVFYAGSDLTKVVHNKYIYSDDNGNNWSSPQDVPIGDDTVSASPYGAMVTMGGGKLLQPKYGWRTGVYTTYGIISNDSGKTWGDEVVILQGTVADRWNEASIVYLGGGYAVGLVREEAGTHYTQVKTTDNGVTWVNQGEATFDSWTNPSPPWLVVDRGAFGGQYVHAYWVNRDDSTLKAITAVGPELIEKGVSAWRLSTLRHLQTASYGRESGSAYPTVVVPYGERRSLGWFYDGKTENDADITFFTENFADADTIHSRVIVVDSVITIIHPSTLSGTNRANGLNLLGQYGYNSPRIFFSSTTNLAKSFAILKDSAAEKNYLNFTYNATPGVSSGTTGMIYTENGRLAITLSTLPDSSFETNGGAEIRGGLLVNQGVTSSSAASIAQLKAHRNAVGIVGGAGGIIDFQGTSGLATQSTFARLYGIQYDTTASAYDGGLAVGAAINGTVGIVASFKNDSALYLSTAINPTSGTGRMLAGSYYTGSTKALDGDEILTSATTVSMGATTGNTTVNNTLQVPDSITVGTSTPVLIKNDGSITASGTVTPIGRLIVPMGEINYYDTTNTGTTVSIVSATTGSTNYVKSAPTTALSADAYEFDNGGSDNGRLRYTGTVTKMFHVALTISAIPATPSDKFLIGISKNGVILPTSRVTQSMFLTTDIQSTALHVMVELATNDYLEVVLGNYSGTGDVNVVSLTLFAMGM